MLGTLGRYLRFMGYDTISANSITPGNTREDSLLLEIAAHETRVLLTRDRDLAKRGGELAIFINPVSVLNQIQELVDRGLVDPRIRLTRCSLCNEILRRARDREILNTRYAPEQRARLKFYWCVHCKKLYWTGSHADDLANRLKIGIQRPVLPGER